VHIVGGGALNDFLNQLTADRSGRRILAGPEEATVLGNLLVQARTLGCLPHGVSVRDAARSSTVVREFRRNEGTKVCRPEHSEGPALSVNQSISEGIK